MRLLWILCAFTFSAKQLLTTDEKEAILIKSLGNDYPAYNNQVSEVKPRGASELEAVM